MSSAASSPVRLIVATVSDTRTEADDASGRALEEELAAFKLLRRVIVADEPVAIGEALDDAVAEADAIVFTGGTGIAPRDVTYEAIAGRLEKRLDGFGEAFRRLSYDQIGPRSILSRATAGTIGTCLVFLLPGSEKAARLGARELIAPVLAHGVDLVNGRTKHHRHG